MLKENENKFQKKSGKFSGTLGQLLNAFLKPFALKTTRCIGMNATHITFYLI
jgi:hypothetical protein